MKSESESCDWNEIIYTQFTEMTNICVVHQTIVSRPLSQPQFGRRWRQLEPQMASSGATDGVSKALARPKRFGCLRELSICMRELTSSKHGHTWAVITARQALQPAKWSGRGRRTYTENDNQ